MSAAESFGRSAVAQFINSPIGRVVRIVVGAALVWWGYSQDNPIVMAVGLVPLAAGLFHLCLISALLGGPLRGARVGKGTP